MVNGRRIKSLVFTTDLAIIRNYDADAVFAVYPFTPQSAISHALINGSYIPVFCGCGGGTTKGLRTLSLAQDAEGQGAMGIVLNAPISDLNLLAVTKVVDIPVIITVVSEETDIAARLASGASILNVAAGPAPQRWCKKSAAIFRRSRSLRAAAIPKRAFRQPSRPARMPSPSHRPPPPSSSKV